MDELLLTVVVYELQLLLLVTNFCFSGCPVYRGLWGVRSFSFTVSAFRSVEGACCSRCRNRTICCFDYPHCSQRNLLAGFLSAFSGDSAQYCANRIHSVNNIGVQPLPLKNNANLKVSVSPIGFFQNTACISLGHRSFNNSRRRVRHLLLRKKKKKALTVHFECGHSTCVVLLIKSDCNSQNSKLHPICSIQSFAFMSKLSTLVG